MRFLSLVCKLCRARDRACVSAGRCDGTAVNIQFEELPGLTVTVDDVVYDPSLNAPPDKPHPFVYYITIDNKSEETVTIFGRKWVIRDSGGLTQVVEGDGVVGKFPRLEPGRRFKYNSYMQVGSESRVHGAFFGATTSGRAICVQVPEFGMEPPPMLA